MLRIARHAMLLLSLLALLAVLYIVNAIRQVEVVETIRIPSTAISAGLPKVADPARFREVCFLLARTVDEAAIRRRKDYDELTRLVLVGLKVALGFATASVVVLLLGWVAAGRASERK